MRSGPLWAVLALLVFCLSPAFAQGYAVRAWGDNRAGETNVPPDLTNAVAIAAGAEHSLALTTEGTVIAWGGNSAGQTTVPEWATNVTAIAAGYDHNLALLEDGTVAGWGRNLEGQVDVPAEATNVVAISAGAHSSFALRGDGMLVAWGQNQYGQTNVPPGPGFRMITGAYHGLALRDTGSVAGWGHSFWDQSNGATAGSNVVAVAAGVLHSLAVKEDGSVVAWGRNLEGQTNVPATLTNAVSVAGGLEHSLALKSDERVVAWGRNLYGEADVPGNLRHVVAIAAGASHSLALTGDVPRPPLPVPEVEMIPRLSVTTGTDGELQLQYRETLAEDDIWMGLSAVVATNGSSVFYDIPVSETGRFYRASSTGASSSVALQLVPRLTLRAEAGHDYRVEYRRAAGPADAWFLLEVVSITNNPQFYFDLTAIGKPARLYRLWYTNSL